MNRRVTLVGYRACGKSTVGRLMAARLGWPFVDADQELERRLGMSIADLCAARGEAAFRDQEQALLAELTGMAGPQVLATGGGVVIRSANRERLRSHGGLVVWLRAAPAVVQERLRRNPGGRMSLSGASPAEEAPRIMAEREPWYQEVAGLVVEATGSEQALAEAVVRAVE
jgi:shikimate kinase